MFVPQTTLRKQINTIGQGYAPATFGELLQGTLTNNIDFLVTFPITSCFSKATFTQDTQDSKLAIYPACSTKSKILAEKILNHYNLPLNGKIVIESNIPKGKGLASSSADLVSVARAIDSYYELNLPVTTLECFMRDIEPSDGVMYPGSVLYYHKEVRLGKTLGPIPPLTVVSIDEGGKIDTIKFNRITKPFDLKEKQEYESLLAGLGDAIRYQDIFKIGEITTRSSILNQKLNPKRTLDKFINLSQTLDALGVVAAHSGTYLGILLSKLDPDYPYKLTKAICSLEKISDAVFVYHS